MGLGKFLAVFALLAVLVAGFLGLAIGGFHNTEVALRTQYEAKVDANKADFDNVWKTITQVAQVPAKYKDDFQTVYESYMQARQGGNTGQAPLLAFLTEAVPQYDAKELYLKVQTVVESKREAWTTRQKELVDIRREHSVLLRTIPGVFYNVFLSREELPLVLVTSSRTEDAFQTGLDNEVDLF